MTRPIIECIDTLRAHFDLPKTAPDDYEDYGENKTPDADIIRMDMEAILLNLRIRDGEKAWPQDVLVKELTSLTETMNPDYVEAVQQGLQDAYAVRLGFYNPLDLFGGHFDARKACYACGHKEYTEEVGYQKTQWMVTEHEYLEEGPTRKGTINITRGICKHCGLIVKLDYDVTLLFHNYQKDFVVTETRDRCFP